MSLMNLPTKGAAQQQGQQQDQQQGQQQDQQQGQQQDQQQGQQQDQQQDQQQGQQQDQQQGQETDIQKQLRELQANTGGNTQNTESQKPSFEPANELVTKINQMFADGASKNKIRQFMDLQFLDYENMSPVDVISTKLRQEHPDFSSTELDFLIEEKYGTRPNREDYGEEEEDKFKRDLSRYETKIKVASKEAKKDLEQVLVNLENDPELAKRKQSEDGRRAVAAQQWGAIASSLASQEMKLPVQVEVGDGVNYELSYQPPNNPEIDEKINQLAVQQMVQAGAALDEANVQKLSEIRENMYRAKYFNEILKEVVRDSYASAQEMLAKRNQGRRRVAIDQGNQTQQRPQGQQRPRPMPKGRGKKML